MQLAYRGSVNSWECDENNHLNVRFYVEKHWQTLCGAISMLTHPSSHQMSHQTPHQSSPDGAGLVPDVSVQHIRFLQESRLAAPLSGYAGVIYAGQQHFDVLTELRQSFTGEPVSTCVHRIADGNGDANGDTNADTKVTDELPKHAGPRGLADVDLAYSVLPLDGAGDYGFETIGMGVVQPDECQSGGPDGLPAPMRIHNYMARLTDSMPHLWGELRAESGELHDNEGGAILEYRLRYHASLRQGEHFVIKSAMSSVSNKVLRFAHLFYNAEDGALCVSAEAAGVCIDLAERRAKVLTQDMQEHMGRRLLKPFAA